MSLILFAGIALILFGGFLLLTVLETRMGRVGERARARLDRFAHRVEFVVAHVDWSALTKHLVRTGTERVLHDCVHGALVVVRFIERTLTRLVRSLRERRAGRVSSHPRQKMHIRETLRKLRISFKRVSKQDVSLGEEGGN